MNKEEIEFDKQVKKQIFNLNYPYSGLDIRDIGDFYFDKIKKKNQEIRLLQVDKEVYDLILINTKDYKKMIAIHNKIFKKYQKGRITKKLVKGLFWQFFHELNKQKMKFQLASGAIANLIYKTDSQKRLYYDTTNDGLIIEYDFDAYISCMANKLNIKELRQHKEQIIEQLAGEYTMNLQMFHPEIKPTELGMKETIEERLNKYIKNPNKYDRTNTEWYG